MNYFYFFFFLSLAIIILIKPFTQFISAWVMRSERLTVTGLLTGSLGLLFIYISLLDPFWFERMWMIVTFVLGILLLMRGFFIIFFLGVMGIFLNRKNVIVILMSIELILLAVNINLISFSIFSGNIIGQIFTMLILTVAAAEAAIGLAIIVIFYRNKGSIRVEDIHGMKG